MKKHYRKENDCLNCGTILEGRFCHNCGQENLQMKESFGHMMNHAISDYFHFDDQFFHTMRPLFFKPGFLTTQYMAGHRAGYLHPVKMYIFISLIFFVVMFKTDHNMMTVNNNPGKAKVVSQATIDSIQRDPDIPNFTKKIIIDGLKKGEGSVSKNNGIISIQSGNTSGGFLDPTTSDTSYKAYIASQQKLPPNKRDGIFERLYNKKVFGYKTEYGNMAREIIIENFEHNIPKMMFVLLPICALILMVVFRDKTKYYVEYLIYSFHLHCFIFLFITLLMLMEWLIPSETINGFISFLSFLVIVWYVYKSLRVVFHRSKFRTITKMIGAYLVYLFSFVVCLTAVFFITALIT